MAQQPHGASMVNLYLLLRQLHLLFCFRGCQLGPGMNGRFPLFFVPPIISEHLFYPGRWHSKSHIPGRIFIVASKSNIILSSCDWHVARRDFLIAFLRRFASCYRCQFCSFCKCNSHQVCEKPFNLLDYFFSPRGTEEFVMVPSQVPHGPKCVHSPQDETTSPTFHCNLS